MGPTASGKSDLAIRLTQHMPCDIISVDSGMIYRGLDIGTAKPSFQELQLAPHRLINICDPAETYSAAQFRRDALKEIEAILACGRIPLLVGGTMLYFRVLQQGISDLPKANSIIRAQLSAEAKQSGWQKLHERLQKIDPVAAVRISASDSQRLQRALEVFILTGKTLTQLFAENPLESLPYQVINLAIAPTDREVLTARISKRFALMLQQGLVAEVEGLYKRKDLHENLPAIRTVGYRQVWQHLNGKLNYDEMKERAIIATRQLAKRQLTWLRSWKDVAWFDSGNDNLKDEILNYIKKF